MQQKDIERLVFQKIIANPKDLPSNLNKVSPKDFSIKIAKDVVGALQQNGYSVHFAPTVAFFEILLRDRIRDKEDLKVSSEALAKMSKKEVPTEDLDLLIKELKKERMCSEFTRILSSAAGNIGPENIESTYEEMMKKLLKLPLGGTISNTIGIVRDVHDDVKNRIDLYFEAAARRIPACLKAFEAAIGGYSPGELITLTAGTGQGKSAVMLWLCEQWLKVGKNVCYITIEMSYAEVMERYHAMITGYKANWIRNKTLNREQLGTYIQRLIARSKKDAAAAAFFRKCEGIVDPSNPKYALDIASEFANRENKFWVLDIPKECSPARVEREILRLSLDAPVEIVVVDYLNIMEPNYRYSRDWVREQGSIAKDLKEVARRTETLVMCGAQLNTAAMKAGDKVGPDNIKYARAIAENSDWVIAFNRDPNGPAANQIKLELAKHRHSRPVTALLQFDFETFQAIDRGEYMEGDGIEDVEPAPF